MIGNDLETILKQQENLVETSTESLEDKINTLITTLNRELVNLEKLKAGDLSYAPNGLGIVQNQGNFIDAECGRLFALVSNVKFIKGMK